MLCGSRDEGEHAVSIGVGQGRLVLLFLSLPGCLCVSRVSILNIIPIYIMIVVLTVDFK